MRVSRAVAELIKCDFSSYKNCVSVSIFLSRGGMQASIGRSLGGETLIGADGWLRN